MINLERHIEVLLLSNDCVIVPDFGGFMAHHIEAHYDKLDTMFFPPIRTIGFNPQLKLNDSLLVQSYIEAYDISYPDAMKRIENEVAEVKQRIEIDGKYVMNNVGTLGINEFGKYYFEPCAAGILTPELYGLGAVEMLQLEQLAAAEQVEKAAKVVETVAEQTKPTGEQAPQSVLQNNEEEETSPRGYVKISVLRNIAAVLIAVVAFFMFSSPLGNQSTLKTSGTLINTDMLYRVLPHDYTTGTVLSKNNQDAKNAKKKNTSENIIAGNTQHAVKSTYHTIVMASRVSRKNAREYVTQLHKRGFNEVRIHTDKKNTKVIFGKYNSQSKARAVLNKLNDNYEFADCWITTIAEN